MPIARRTMALVLLLVAGWALALPAAGADRDEGERAAARAAVAELATEDDAALAKAAARLAELGSAGAEEIGLRGEALDNRSWRACADAFVAARRSWCAFTFVSAARKAPAAHAQRLLALAHALDPLAGVQRTPEETAAEVRQLLIHSGRDRCATGYDERIALLGHAAVAPLLDLIRAGDPASPGGSVACSAVSLLAEPEDLPAIRELVLAGKVNLVRALETLRAAGDPGATRALLDAIGAGRVDSEVTRALARVPDRALVLATVNAWIAGQDAVPDAARANLAALFAALEARDAAPTLVSWIASSKEPDTFVALADALVALGDPRGVGLLVRIASEGRTRFPCRPSTPEEDAAAAAPGRLCPEGFAQWDRERAVEKLGGIAGDGVRDAGEGAGAAGAGPASDEQALERAAAAFRTWWDASRDRLTYDPATGRWSVP